MLRLSFPIVYRNSLAGVCAICGLWLMILPGCSWLNRPMVKSSARAHQFNAEAEEHVAKREFKEAEKLYKQSLLTNPDDGEIFRKLAEIQQTQGRHAEAIASLKKATDKTPDDPRIWFELGRLQHSQGKLKEARDNLDQALKYDPAHLDALKLRAEIYEFDGEYELALVACQRILAHSPEDLRTRIQTADLEIKLGRPDRAAPILRNLCDCEQADPSAKMEALWKLGEAYAQIGRWHDASEVFAQVQQKRPLNNAEEWYRVAYVNYMIQNWEVADLAVRNALRLQNNHAEAHVLANSLRLVQAKESVIQQTTIKTGSAQ